MGPKSGLQTKLTFYFNTEFFVEQLACYGSDLLSLILPTSPLIGSCEDKEGVNREVEGRNKQGWKVYQTLFKIFFFQLVWVKVKKILLKRRFY